MLPNATAELLSRWQFGLTASYHFLFVPLTLGLSWLLVIMETTYLITGKEIYRDMTRFWGKLFAINFVMGVITGLTLEFQFGQNWAYFAQYSGDVFGIPLAIEGITAFMLESTMFGIFMFGWNRVSKVAHWISTCCLAVGSSLSALVILVANGWMQRPAGAHFNYLTHRMTFDSWKALWLNSDAQVRFVHTVAAGYTTGAIFVLAISSFYLLKHRDSPFAKRSFAIACGFGMAAVLSVLLLGDVNGTEVERVQPPKMAAMEGQWNTQKAPAAWDILAWPDQANHRNVWSLSIPWGLSLIAHHNLSGTVEGLNQIGQGHYLKIQKGLVAYRALQRIEKGDKSRQTFNTYNLNKRYLGYALLLQGNTKNPNIAFATQQEIHKVAMNAIPNVFTLFYGFRIMVAAGLLMFLVFLTALFFCVRRTIWKKRWLLWCYVLALPLPWIAVIAGWFIAEHGRQPWVIYGVLPTAGGASTLQPHDVIVSLGGFGFFYTALFIVEIVLMVKYIRLGPSSLGTGKYHYEKDQPALTANT